jgi:hypothetical protein
MRSKILPSAAERCSFTYSACAHNRGTAAPVGPPKRRWCEGRFGASQICSGIRPIPWANWDDGVVRATNPVPHQFEKTGVNDLFGGKLSARTGWLIGQHQCAAIRILGRRARDVENWGSS